MTDAMLIVYRLPSFPMYQPFYIAKPDNLLTHANPGLAVIVCKPGLVNCPAQSCAVVDPFSNLNAYKQLRK